MKKIILALILVFTFTGLSAKKIKFAVDMGTYTISPFGIHLMSSFQGYLGLPLGDWQPNTLQLNQEGLTTIYSVILNLPAFAEYEFKFVNGDQTYEAEFVPNESRVDYSGLGVDNRWIYLDSLGNDTAFVGAIPFSGNAPVGKSLLRFLVDMSNAGTVSSNGVHVAGTFQSTTWNAKNNILYSFGSNIYDVITYAVNGTYEFKYYNGNVLTNTETVPAPCANGGGNRTHPLIKDTILPIVCYSACVSCALAGIHENAEEISGVKMYPNPATELSVIEFSNKEVDYKLNLCDVSGRVLKTYLSNNGEEITIRKNELSSGLYFVNITDSKNAKRSAKLIIE